MAWTHANKENTNEEKERFTIFKLDEYEEYYVARDNILRRYYKVNYYGLIILDLIVNHKKTNKEIIEIFKKNFNIDLQEHEINLIRNIILRNTDNTYSLAVKIPILTYPKTNIIFSKLSKLFNFFYLRVH